MFTVLYFLVLKPSDTHHRLIKVSVLLHHAVLKWVLVVQKNTKTHFLGPIKASWTSEFRRAAKKKKLQDWTTTKGSDC